MALNSKQIKNLNKMNKAAQDVNLGDMLKNGALTNEYVLTAATEAKLGGVKMSANVAEAAGTEVTAAEFKALIDALIDAGIMAEA